MSHTVSGNQTANANAADKRTRLRKFILDHLDRLDYDAGGGSYPDLPSFDLRAQDYLAFAESELNAFLLNNGGHGHLINCVAHLKRAADCQLDTFLHVFNLYRVFRDRNLKFEKKLDFLASAGVFSSRSLRRLNTIRNQMEHEFAAPEVGEIEVYYDLVVAFVAVLQAAIARTLNSELNFSIDDSNGKWIGSFSIEYEFEGPLIRASWQLPEGKQELQSSIEDCVEFAFFFRVLLLLGQLDTFASTRYIAMQLSA